MKIKRLELKAFGPFSGRTLDFSSDTPGLHVVYGQNESGKSSSMRALQALLFGVPARTNDNFLHSYEQLLVGGCLQGSEGQELTFYRRKKRLGDLFDQNDNLLSPSVLLPYLHGMELDLYTTLYGIDHEALVKGGKGILDQQGAVGQALFSAGAGLASLTSILDELEGEGDNLFRPRGSSKAINESLAHYKELQIQINRITLSSREWQDHQGALEEAERKLTAANNLRGRLNREKRQLERLKQALPYLGQRSNMSKKLAELGAFTELRSDFGERRRSLEQQGRDFRSRLETAEARLHELLEKKKGLFLDQGLLDHGDAIEGLHQRLGQYGKAKNDRPQLEGRRIGFRTEGASLLKQIRPDLSIDDIDVLRPGLLKRKTIQNLGARHEALVQGVRKIGRQVQSIRIELEKAQNDWQQLSHVADIGKLSQTVIEIQKAGDLDGEIKAKRQSWDVSQKGCRAALQRLGLWSGPLHLVGQLAVPLPETLKRYEDGFHSITEEKRQIGIEEEQLDTELAQFVTQLQEIEYTAEIPTEEELINNRKQRDRGWQLIRRQWLLGEDVAEESREYDSEHPLPEAYEKRVGFSDQTADRLYREADRVQKHASLKARIEGVEKRLAELRKREEKNSLAMAEITRRWQELWTCCNITPLPPREMYAWLNSFEKLCFQADESDKIAGAVDGLENRRSRIKTSLLADLTAAGEQQNFPGEELSLPLLHAEALVKRIQEDHARRETLQGKISDLKTALETSQLDQHNAEEELRQWQLLWGEAVTSLGLDCRTLPAEASDFIDTLQACFEQLKEADEFRKRIDGIDRDARGFEETVSALAGRIAPDLISPDAVLIVSELNRRLSQAIQEKAVLQKFEEEISVLEKTIILSRTNMRNYEAQMEALCQQARCSTPEELNEAERRSNEALKLKNDLEEIENILAKIAEGIAISNLEEQAQGIDPDELSAQIELLASKVEMELNPEIQQLSEIIGREKGELKRMDGSSGAAELADTSQQALAKIRRLTERYIRLKLAAMILREEIERYRAENQDPVMKIASRYFQKLTLSSFSGLRTEIDDQEQLVLIGIRSNGTWLNVAGMSSGTRDQLYLALRIATLEWRLQSGEPMPFIVDDILINFDDQRSKATLEALADLAEKTQVILFTHHKQILEAAQNMTSSDNVFVHQL